MPPTGFEPTILASERPQTHALDRPATGIGNMNISSYINSRGHEVSETEILASQLTN
jgi:hypothetical protein